jgi:hypothetical protein
MILNLHTDERSVDLILQKQDPAQKILDFTGTLSSDKYNITHIRAIDRNNEIEKRAIKNYVDFCADISTISVGKTPVRNLKLLDVPVYWLTKISEKHYVFHWGQTLFFLKQILEERIELFENEKRVLIILPDKFRHAEYLFIQVLEQKGLTADKFIYTDKKYNETAPFRFLSNQIKNLYLSLVFIANKHAYKTQELSEYKNIFVTKYPGSWQRVKRDIDLTAIYKFSQNSGFPAIYIPYLETQNIKDLDFIVDSRYIKSFPGIIEIFKLFGFSCLYYLRIFFFSHQQYNIGGLKINSRIIKNEVTSVINNYMYFFNFSILKKYFSSIKAEGKIKVFYSDEFYTYGRTITLAARAGNNSDIHTVGLQHGLLLTNHTVYVITDKELADCNNFKNGIPIPDSFIVWGEYFKKLFLKHNSLPNEYAIAAGNMKYFFIEKKATPPDLNICNILWCTSLPANFKDEYKIISPVLKELDNYSLTIRLHPSMHIVKSQLQEWIEKEIWDKCKVSDEPDIFNDIQNHNIVISTAFSATFFDTLIMGKKSCRMISELVCPDFTDMKIQNLYDIRTKEDFKEVIENLANQTEYLKEENGVMVKDLCSFRINEWNKILNN